jgi:hypothetical protein
MCTAEVYDNTAMIYNVSLVMNDDNSFNVTKYAEYSPAFLPATYAFVYGLAFAALTALPVHVYLWHGTEIWDAFTGKTKLDIHARLMRRYPPVPWYWFAGITVVVFSIAVGMVKGYHTKLPWWAVILALAIPAVYMIPCGIIQGTTNVDANQLNILSEFMGGYMFQGRPLASEWTRSCSWLTKLILSRHDLQHILYRCRRARSLLCTRHEAGSLPQSISFSSLLYASH